MRTLMLKLLCIVILFSFQVNAALNTVAGFTGEKVVLTSMQKNISDSPGSVISSNSSVFPVKSSFLHPGVVSARSMSMGGEHYLLLEMILYLSVG